MLIIIEHSGTKDHNAQAKEIAEFLEDTFGATVQPVISNNTSDIILRDENLKVITQFPTKPDNDIIYFYVNSYLFDED